MVLEDEKDRLLHPPFPTGLAFVVVVEQPDMGQILQDHVECHRGIYQEISLVSAGVFLAVNEFNLIMGVATMMEVSNARAE